MAQPPDRPKIYHILHVDRLASVIRDGRLLCDAVMTNRTSAGTAIGMPDIKLRRLRLEISCRPGLYVGNCVPFYFCPRSVMLYLIYRANHPDLTYRGGQESIIHLEADLYEAVDWIERSGERWAFTLSNAGALYFEDRCDLAQLSEINWDAVQATQWSGPSISSLVQEGKQAEFLAEKCFPLELIERVGVFSKEIAMRATNAITDATFRPKIEIRRDWYY